VEQQPFSVILLDEIEKAHPSVLDALLGVLGEGRLTDTRGRTVDFTSTIIVMTSNLGVREATHHLGFGEVGRAEAHAAHIEAARRFFRPELFNRLDRVVCFRALEREDLAPLVERLLARMLGRRGLARSSVLVEVDAAVVRMLVEQGFDARYGARSVRREIEQRLALPLAEHLVAQPEAPLTIARVGARGESITLALEWPRVDARPSLGVAPITDWPTLDAAVRGLDRRLEAVDADPSLDAVARGRGVLLRGYNEGALSQAGEVALDVWSELLAERAAIHAALEQVRDTWLEIEPFVEGYEVERRRLQRKFPATPPVEPVARLVPFARGAFRPDRGAEIRALELRLASLLQRLGAARSADEPAVLVRFTPFDPRARAFAAELCAAWAEAWGPQGLSTRYRRVGEAWREFAPDDPMEGAAPSEAWALLLSGPGARAWVEHELGWVLDVERAGGAEVLELVAIERVEADEDVSAALARADAQPPRGLLLRRRFVDGVCLDAETGVRVEREPRVRVGTRVGAAGGRLGRALREVGLLRVLAGAGPG
jgi:hypothetical protein